MLYSKTSETLCNWPYNWFGLWTTSEIDNKNLPIRDELVDCDWFFPEKTLLLEYLKSAPIVISTLLRPTCCLRCGENLGDPGCWRSDNVWLWPNSLFHHVEKHHIRLPNRMVKHIVANKFQVPSETTVSIKDLPWPQKDLGTT